MCEQNDVMLMESDEYKKGYQNVVLKLQNQINLQSRKGPKTNKFVDEQAPDSHPKKNDPKADPWKKIQEEKESNAKESEKTQPSFSFESEIAKIKIFFPLNELLKNTDYKGQIQRILKLEGENFDALNLQDDHPSLLFGP